MFKKKLGTNFESCPRQIYLVLSRAVLTFPFTIRNQFTAALSTLEAGIALKRDLMTYQGDFYREMRKNKGSEEVY